MSFRFARLVSIGLTAAVAMVAVPVAAAVDGRDPGRFVDSLAETSFAAIDSGKSGASRAQFRAILAQHFAVTAIGDRLIQRWRPKISAAQYAQYKSAFPGFIIATYADRLAPYADADLKVVRVVPQGSGAAVVTTVTRPGGRPANAIWSVTKVGGTYKVTNLTVSGVNLGMAQQADFDSTIQRRGFDALVAFMKSRG